MNMELNWGEGLSRFFEMSLLVFNKLWKELKNEIVIEHVTRDEVCFTIFISDFKSCCSIFLLFQSQFSSIYENFEGWELNKKRSWLHLTKNVFRSHTPSSWFKLTNFPWIRENSTSFRVPSSTAIFLFE